jgi:hypothetical protein
MVHIFLVFITAIHDAKIRQQIREVLDLKKESRHHHASKQQQSGLLLVADAIMGADFV